MEQGIQQIQLSTADKKVKWENIKYKIKTKIDFEHIYTELQWNKLGYKLKRSAIGEWLYPTGYTGNGKCKYYLPREVSPMTEKDIERIKKARAKERKRKQQLAIEQQRKDLERYKERVTELEESWSEINYKLIKANRELKKLRPLTCFKELYIQQFKQSLQQIEDTTVKDIEYIVLDTETTGLNAFYDEILQLSIVDDNGNALFNDYFNVGAESWEEAEAINGISKDMVKDKPYIYKRAIEIQQILSRAKGVVCYNAQFDLSFLANVGFIVPSLLADVMLDFAPIYGEYNDYWGDYKWQKLTTCADYYNFNWEQLQAHDSLADALATLHCYKCIKEQEQDTE